MPGQRHRERPKRWPDRLPIDREVSCVNPDACSGGLGKVMSWQQNSDPRYDARRRRKVNKVSTNGLEG